MTFGEFRFYISKCVPGLDPDVLDGAINNRYQQLLDFHPWQDLIATASVATVAPYTTGAVTATQGSAAITGSGTVWTSAMTGSRIRIWPGNETYGFTYGSATSATLDRNFEDTTASGATFQLFTNVYALATDYKQPVNASNERLPGELNYISLHDLRAAVPTPIAQGEPQFYAPSPDTADGSNNLARNVELYPIPLYSASYPYRYIRSAPRFAQGDTGLSIFSFVSISALEYASRAQLTTPGPERDRWELLYKAELDRMLMRDARLKGPQKLKMADAYTRHRIGRSLRGYRSGLNDGGVLLP